MPNPRNNNTETSIEQPPMKLPKRLVTKSSFTASTTDEPHIEPDTKVRTSLPPSAGTVLADAPQHLGSQKSYTPRKYTER